MVSLVVRKKCVMCDPVPCSLLLCRCGDRKGLDIRIARVASLALKEGAENMKWRRRKAQSEPDPPSVGNWGRACAVPPTTKKHEDHDPRHFTVHREDGYPGPGSNRLLGAELYFISGIKRGHSHSYWLQAILYFFIPTSHIR